MDKKINRIRLGKLYSDNDAFEEIVFQDGINLILGEKYDDSKVAGRKTNGVGKSLSIEFLDFCLLNDYADSRLKKIPSSILPHETNILLDLEIGEIQLTIRRNRKEESQPVFFREGMRVSFDKLKDARKYLGDLLFAPSTGSNIPGFRRLLSILMRDERSEFVDILACHEAKKRIPADLTPHLYLMGININAYDKILATNKQIEVLTTVIAKDRKELTSGNKKIAEVQADLNAANDDLSKMEVAIDSFKSNVAFEAIESELIELDSVLENLRNKQKILKHEYQKIKTMPKPDEIDDTEIEVVYNQFKDNLGYAVVKSLQEVVGFKSKVENFQKMLISQKAKELQLQLKDLSESIRVLDDEYAEKIKILDQKGILKNLKTSLKIFEERKHSNAHTRYLYEQFEKNTKRKKELQLQKFHEILDLDNLLELNKVTLSSIENTILNIHEKIMGNKQSSFSIKAVDKSKSKSPVSIDLRIFDDGSHSVNRTKVFIYDMSLMFNDLTSVYHPQYLVHDNIFDVDQDTLVQCLNYLYEQEEKYSDFQYILTLNRDKIENEERLKLIKLDIPSHTVASFTKKRKFLGRDYQEN